MSDEHTLLQKERATDGQWSLFIKVLILLLIAGVILLGLSIFPIIDLYHNYSNSIPTNLQEDIGNMEGNVQKFLKHVLEDEKYYSYKLLQQLCDTFGPRKIGDDSLERSIDWFMEKMKQDGFENVHKEPVRNIPLWRRGTTELMEIQSPIQRKIQVKALGNSVSTPNGLDLIGEIIVVKNFEELEARKDEVKGKIVLYNVPYNGYGRTVPYRSSGARRAAALGAIASLTRSITDFSLQTVHIGNQYYATGANSTKIPAGAITVEDADFIERLVLQHGTVTIRLQFDCFLERNDYQSYNLIGEITGTEKPDEIIIVSGHIDSWDVGVGAMDDGAGVTSMYNIVRSLITLGLKPKRTIRMILFTAEEIGALGGISYYEAHKQEKVVYATESDNGVFTPEGVYMAAVSTESFKVVQYILNKYLKQWGVTHVKNAVDGADVISWWVGKKVPLLSPMTKSEKYFWYHHTEADQLNVMSPDDLDKTSASFGVLMYVLANLDTVIV